LKPIDACRSKTDYERPKFRVGAYTEWFAFIPSGADTARTEHYFNGGFSYLISNNIQFDILAGVGLNDAADDYFLGTGLSIRFP